MQQKGLTFVAVTWLDAGNQVDIIRPALNDVPKEIFWLQTSREGC
jgi:hypothetical protein